MKAIFTTMYWSEVENADEAAEMVTAADNAARLNIEAVFEQNGASVDELRGRLGFLGTSFWLIEEERVLG